MADAIVKSNGVGGGGLAAWTPEQKELIKRTCANGATDDELALFLHVAARAQLDPLRKQIHFIKAGGRFYTVADVNGLQARAAREADFEGITHAVVYAKDDFQIDNVTGQVVRHTSNPLGQNGPPIGAWASVRRRGMLPFTAVVRFDEYRNQGNQLWASKPAVMIDKCAKSTALRLAYPEQLGNIYDEAELGKEEVEVNEPPPAPTTPPKTAAAAKAQLEAAVAKQAAAQGQVVDAAPRKSRMKIEDNTVPAANPHWTRILAIASEHGMSAEATKAEMKSRFSRTKPADITEADVTAFAAWIDDAVPPPDAQTLPPPPAGQVEADVPF
jgi:phage recombination protein Bet